MTVRWPSSAGRGHARHPPLRRAHHGAGHQAPLSRGRLSYGPATDNGFYYDVDLPEGVKISEDDFPAIEAEMKKIVKENLKFTV